jgi:hypothetical protein
MPNLRPKLLRTSEMSKAETKEVPLPTTISHPTKRAVKHTAGARPANYFHPPDMSELPTKHHTVGKKSALDSRAVRAAYGRGPDLELSRYDNSEWIVTCGHVCTAPVTLKIDDIDCIRVSSYCNGERESTHPGQDRRSWESHGSRKGYCKLQPKQCLSSNKD